MGYLNITKAKTVTMLIYFKSLLAVVIFILENENYLLIFIKLKGISNNRRLFIDYF